MKAFGPHVLSGALREGPICDQKQNLSATEECPQGTTVQYYFSSQVTPCSATIKPVNLKNSSLGIVFKITFCPGE